MDVELIGDFPNAYRNTEMDYMNYENNLKILYSNISRSVMDDVCEMYKWDFLLFDYDITKFCPSKFWKMELEGYENKKGKKKINQTRK